MAIRLKFYRANLVPEAIPQRQIRSGLLGEILEQHTRKTREAGADALPMLLLVGQYRSLSFACSTRLFVQQRVVPHDAKQELHVTDRFPDRSHRGVNELPAYLLEFPVEVARAARQLLWSTAQSLQLLCGLERQSLNLGARQPSS